MLTQVNVVPPAEVAEQDASWFAPERRSALLALLRGLGERGYCFVTTTPATHARVLSRPTRRVAGSLRDVLGWSLPFTRDVVDADMLALLEAAGAVRPLDAGRYTPTLRVSTVAGQMFLHSAYPTLADDSVFLGPDSYRFAQFIANSMAPDARRVLDYGTGAGVGGITAAARAWEAHLTLADINPKALFLAGINAEHAGLRHETMRVRSPNDLEPGFDLIVTHPPFMIDEGRRAYRDGGDLYGARLSLEWVIQGSALLAPGGRLILHTGVSIVEGRDVLLDALRERLPAAGFELDYRELDPDIFSEDLDQPGYGEVERISAVGLILYRTT